MNKQAATKTTKLPAHLQAVVDKHAAKMKKFGLLDLSKIDRSKFDDFHPIHAMVAA
ncbi:MAG: hypothetical protein RL030_1755 [Pseudomonadota bacterium]|jgi:hypothetical protein